MAIIINRMFLRKKIILNLALVIFCMTTNSYSSVASSSSESLLDSIGGAPSRTPVQSSGFEDLPSSSSSISSNGEEEFQVVTNKKRKKPSRVARFNPVFQQADRYGSTIRALNCNYCPRGGFFRSRSGTSYYSDWLTYLSPDGFTNDSVGSNLFGDVSKEIITEQVEKLESLCKTKLNNTDMKLFKIAMGDSNTNPTFNISVHLTKDGAGVFGTEIVGKKRVPNSYKEEIVIDIHFNYPDKTFRIDQVAFETYFDHFKNLIGNFLEIPDSFDLISEQPQNYGIVSS